MGYSVESTYSIYAKELVVNYEILYQDILIKLKKKKLSQRQLSEYLGMSRQTIFRISKGGKIDISNFLKLVLWLQKDINTYIKVIK